MRRVAADDGTGRYVFGDYRAGRNDRIIANGHAGIDHCPTPNPHIVANSYRLAVFLAAITRIGVQRMSGGINMDAWRQHTVIANMDRADVEHHAVKIGVKTGAEKNIITIVAAKAWLDIRIAGASEQLGQNMLTLFLVIRGGMIITVQQLSGAQAIGAKRWVAR